jgi:ABC-type transporter Mla subunit MlaD
VYRKTAVKQPKAATAAQETAVTPESVVESVRALRGQIPNYVQLPEPTAKTLRWVSSLTPEFTQAAIQAVGASQTVHATVGQSAEELQAAVETAARWAVVRDELRATLDGVTSAVLTMKHSLAQSVLLTYTVSKKLVKVPQHADLLPHVAMMRKANRMGRNRKAQSQTPAPAPVRAPQKDPVPPSIPKI